jgi:hypothetical protein
MPLSVVRIPELVNLTIDTTEITVDSNITVDSTELVQSIHTIKIGYRFWSNNPTLILTNEMTEVTTSYDLVAESLPGIMILNFYHQFYDGDSYEITVLSPDEKLIYRGKLLATNQQDLQNYRLHRYGEFNDIYKL